MWKARLIAVALACAFSATAFAQFQIQGRITDAETGEPLIGAHVVLDDSFSATVSDREGMYVLSDVPAGENTLSVSYVGYASWGVQLELDGSETIDVELSPSAVNVGELVVTATRAQSETPTAFSTVTSEQLEPRNLGQDVPFLLDQTPSVVTTSDAGTGIGYTGLRIRGSDATRINVTINGVPLNDAESQGVFWVDLPDVSSSVEDIQIQRGVGTSTNGAGAFGATVNIQTSHPSATPYASIDNSVGSFNTRKHAIRLGSGLLSDRWSINGRLSMVNSDGYIDRATADLSSYYLSAGYYGTSTTLQAITFSGHETTYQAWWGTPESRLENDAEAMRMHASRNGYTDAQLDNLLLAGRTYNHYLYENEVDDYKQSHYQLHLIHQINPALLVNGALHYTRGQGYFEQFRQDDSRSDYGLEPLEIGSELIEESDFIRRRWLDNHFYGFTSNAIFNHTAVDLTLGGGYNLYDGGHFGEIIWAEFARDIDIRDRYYDNTGEKGDGNVFAKASVRLSPDISLFGDVQLRQVDYMVDGIDNDQRTLDVEASFTFFNPKAGFTWVLGPSTKLYGSFSVGNREPVRDDFIDAPEGRTPEHETLYDTEFGLRYARHRFSADVNLYHMDYTDQLVLTGELNDVGAPVRVNVDDSYRAGVELQLGWQPARFLRWTGNLTLSRNRIQRFDETLYDYTEGFEIVTIQHENTDISFSPGIIAGSTVAVSPIDNLELRLLTKVVGKQYLDNTSNENRSMPSYWVNDIGLTYTLTLPRIRTIDVHMLLSNVLDEKYVSNGYTYSYFYGELITENFYYPQAGRHILVGLTVNF